MKALPLVVSMLLPSLCSADNDARIWLDKMSEAVQSLSYEGTFVYMHGQTMETMQIVHGNAGGDGGERERLLSLTGEAREVIRNKGVLTCIWPGSRSIVMERSRTRLGLHAAIPNAVDHSSEYYTFSVEGKERIAGLKCQTIAITPIDSYRFGYRLCVEEHSGMLLQSAMLNQAGEHIEQVMFTSVQFRDHIPESKFEAVTPAQGFTLHKADPVAAEVPIDPAWRVAKAPAGFSQSSNTRRPMAANQQPVQHMILTDGLASVSVFIAPLDADTGMYEGSTQSGALHAYAKIMNDYQVTVVGEVPEATVRMIGESLRYAASGDD